MRNLGAQIGIGLELGEDSALVKLESQLSQVRNKVFLEINILSSLLEMFLRAKKKVLSDIFTCMSSANI